MSTVAPGLLHCHSRSSVAVRGFLVQMLYRKALKIHGEAAKSVGGGSPTSLMSVDVERIVNQLEPAHLIYSTLIIIVIGLVILYNAVGLSFLATIVAAIVFFVSLPYLSAKVPMLQKSWSATTDLRVKLANSVIRNIKAVKSSGYEDILLSKLEGRRDTEMGMQRQYYRRIMVVAVGEDSLGTYTPNAFPDAPFAFQFHAISNHCYRWQLWSPTL